MPISKEILETSHMCIYSSGTLIAIESTDIFWQKLLFLQIQIFHLM